MSFKKSWDGLAQSLVGTAELTAREVAARAGVDFDQARRLWRALGFPPVPDEDRVFTQADTDMLGAAAALLDRHVTNPDELLQLTRVTGQTLSRLAEAQVSASAERFRDLADGRGAAEDATISASQALVPTLETFIRYVWRRQLLASLLRHSTLAESVPGGGQVLAIGFADLVGFTAVSQALDESELAAMVDRFEALAYEHIPTHGGRIVKMIGDEVMFAAESAFDAAEMALSLSEGFADDALVPRVRVGLALGRTLSWGGDLFGPTVNLASRLVNLAYPGTVLVGEALHAELVGRPDFFLRDLRPVRLKGIGRTHTWVLRRAGERDRGSRKEADRGRRRGTRRERPPRAGQKRAR